MKIHQQRQRHQDRSGNVTPTYAEMEKEKAADPEPRVACLLHSHVPCDATNGLALSEAQGMEGYFDSEFVAVCQVDCPTPPVTTCYVLQLMCKSIFPPTFYSLSN